MANPKGLQLLYLALWATRSPSLAAQDGKQVVFQLLYASFELWSYFPVYRGQLTKDGKTGHMYVKLPLKLLDSCQGTKNHYNCAFLCSKYLFTLPCLLETHLPCSSFPTVPCLSTLKQHSISVSLRIREFSNFLCNDVLSFSCS